MRLGTTRWLLVGVLCLVLSPAVVCAQVTRWEESMAAASQALQEGRYAAAEKLFLGALKEAEKFGDQDPRLATSLNNLALLYHNQGRYAQAEPLYQRALAVVEKAGVRRGQLLIDPGIGFGKTVTQNYELLCRLDRLQKFKLPILIGTSRKSFIGKVLGSAPPRAAIVRDGSVGGGLYPGGCAHRARARRG